jgi:hypothetical protein
MSAPTAPRPVTSKSTDIDAATDVIIFNCSRLGLRANPPRRRLLELLFPSRRR